MKKLITLLLFLTSVHAFGKPEYTFNPIGTFYSNGLYLTDFEPRGFFVKKLDNNQYNLTRMVELSRRVTRGYTLTKDNKPVAFHDCFLHSAGTLFDSAKKFYVHDADDTVIGCIDGAFFTWDCADFTFYDENNEPFAQAILSDGYSTLTVTNLKDATSFTCIKTLFEPNFNEVRYYWSICLDGQELTDERFFWPFMAFISEVWWWGKNKGIAL